MQKSKKVIMSLVGGAALGTSLYLLKKKSCNTPCSDSNENKGESEFSLKHLILGKLLGEYYERKSGDDKVSLNSNILVIGGPGTGKTHNFIKPNILQMDSSYIVTDPSGELYKDTAETLKEHGYKIKVFNPNDAENSDKYNPLAYLYDEASVMSLLENFMCNTGEKKKDSFFENAEKLLLAACIYWIRDDCDDDNLRTFGHVLAMVNSSAVDENDPNRKSPLDEMFDLCDEDSLAKKYYRAFKQASGKTQKSIIISSLIRLQPFMETQIKELTKKDTLELDKFGEEKTALFIVGSNQPNSPYSFFVPMIYQQFFNVHYHKGQKRYDAEIGKQQSPIHVRCMMDEFANHGTIDGFPQRIATMRKYNISVSIILQSISQLQMTYPGLWRDIVSNCDTVLYFGSNDKATTEFVSEKIKACQGGDEENVLTPDEIRKLGQDQCIIIVRGESPHIVGKDVPENQKPQEDAE